MTTKDIWGTLTKEQKTAHVKDAAQQLLTIHNGTHMLSGKRSQGRLAAVKADLEQFLLNTAAWESGKQQGRQ